MARIRTISCFDTVGLGLKTNGWQFIHVRPKNNASHRIGRSILIKRKYGKKENESTSLLLNGRQINSLIRVLKAAQEI